MSVFAEQALVESDCYTYTRYVCSILDHIFGFQASVSAAQVSVESVCGIELRYAL